MWWLSVTRGFRCLPFAAKRGTGKRKIATKSFRWKKILGEEKIDWKKKIRETSDIRKVKNESNFRGGITKKRMGWERLTAWSEIAVDAKNSRTSKLEGGHGELLRSTFLLPLFSRFFLYQQISINDGNHVKNTLKISNYEQFCLDFKSIDKY